MSNQKGTLRTCAAGHRYYKTSDCPVCPVCENNRKSENHFTFSLSAPARRAIENKGISTLEQLSGFTEKELLSLHGIGKTTIPKLREILKKKHMKFKDD